jgi:aminopeptidase N
MDEGLNTFSDARVQDVAFQPDFLVQRFFGGFIPWQFRDIRLSRATDYNDINGYREAARRDAPITPTYQYWPGTHYLITYSKTALWLNTLERLVGWDKLRMAMATYFERFRFKHPTPDDFFSTLNEETGQDLRWFFEEAYATANVYDYAAERLDSVEVATRGFDDGSATTSPTFHESHDDKQFHTTVVVRRIGEGHFPVDVLVTFENGEQVREKWDGQARWQPFEYVKPSKAVSLQVDPDRVLLLDVNYTNNSITLKPKAGEAADRWTLAWIVWLQDLLMNYAFFV